MNRATGLARLQSETFDILVIGGGATGLGCAVDAASRGYSTALIESDDFASATSSRSTKLIHGGVRYLQQGNISLVREALCERARLLRNAPRLVQPIAFVLPVYGWQQRLYYATGLRFYDVLAGGRDVPRSHAVTTNEARGLFPALQQRGVTGAVTYWDAHFDDARLAVALAQTAVDHGAAVANYVRAECFLYEGPRVCGVTALDCERGQRFELRARVAINATGIFADALRKADRPGAAAILTFSRGSHIVVSTSALPITEAALLIPRTSDGRVVFAIPWHGSALVGTTDVAAPNAEMDPHPSTDEIEYLLATVNRYIARPLQRSDVRTAFAGLRPLVNRGAIATSRLSREHVIDVSPSGLVTITGGKWTTYRKMAEDTVDKARDTANLSPARCRTYDLRLHDVPFVPDLDHGVTHEMARTVDDLLARRTRLLFVDAAAARATAPAAADLLASVLGRDMVWRDDQLRAFEQLARLYSAAGES